MLNVQGTEREDMEMTPRRRETPARAEWLPERVLLHSLGEEWPVAYRVGGGRRVAASERGGLLVVSGGVHDPYACRAALQRWLGRRATESLPGWLDAAAAETGMCFTRTSVRNQRTCWASCSARGTISLNQKLMLIPRHLVRYVLVHELCHTVHLDHSPRFWAHVAAWEPEFNHRRRELRAARAYVPAWC